jgi:prepilin-type processing-associated H-X9-DG protein
MLVVMAALNGANFVYWNKMFGSVFGRVNDSDLEVVESMIGVSGTATANVATCGEVEETVISNERSCEFGDVGAVGCVGRLRRIFLFWDGHVDGPHLDGDAVDVFVHSPMAVFPHRQPSGVVSSVRDRSSSHRRMPVPVS